MSFVEDRIFRMPRKWSNSELEKFAGMFKGSVINVSAWQDKDKEGHCYQEYFSNADEYFISNTIKSGRGWQGINGEILIDLEEDLESQYLGRFDAVFNHTTLEHVFDVEKAFDNLCFLSKDIVIIVVPFMQKVHGDYGDFWRFTPEAIKKMFEKREYRVLYLSFNNHSKSSVYIFAIASRKPERWQGVIGREYSDKANKYWCGKQDRVGARAIRNSILTDAYLYIRSRLQVRK